MARIEERLEVDRPIEEAFDYLADFSTTAEWDPGIVEARRGEDGPIGVGSTFHLVSEFNGKRLRLTYVMTEYERPRRFVVVGDGPSFHGVDDIRFTDAGGGRTVIFYRADLKLTGLAKLAAPFMGGRFAELGRKAIAGLRAALDG
jgi:carbon monoxide dehydrogenase subunit G